MNIITDSFNLYKWYLLYNNNQQFYKLTHDFIQ